MPFPEHLIPKLGTVPDTVLAREAGVTSVAVMKQRQKRGIPACVPSAAGVRAAPSAPAAPPPRAPREPRPVSGVALERPEFLEQHIAQLLQDADPVLPGYSSTMKLAATLHAELDAHRRANRPKPVRQTPEEMMEEWHRECPELPDQLLEIAVAVYCDRHGYAVVPKALQAV